jgi:hypothetical protein
MILRVGKGKAGPLIPFYACRLLRITGKPEITELLPACRQSFRSASVLKRIGCLD